MTQKKIVTSGTLFSIRRAEGQLLRAADRRARSRAGARAHRAAARPPDSRLNAHPSGSSTRSTRGEVQDEAAAGPVAERHVAAAGAREPPRQRQAQSRAAVVLPVAAHPGIERPLAQRDRHARAVVADRHPHPAARRAEHELDPARGMAVRVLQQRRQRPAHHLGVALAARKPRGRLDHGGPVGRLPHDRLQVHRLRRRIVLAPGDREQRVDRARQAVDLDDHGLQRLGPLLVPVRAGPQRQLRPAAHPRDRRAQLVRHLAGEPLLVAARGRDPCEQVVQRRRQPRQLVAPRPEVEALVEVVRAPRRRIARHRRHRPQRAVHRPADREPSPPPGAARRG